MNTAYSTVVVHEMGHWMNDRYGSGNGGDGFGEGNADNFATYITDQPIVGEDFCGTGCHVRDGQQRAHVVRQRLLRGGARRTARC